jgi:hypothetical protein
VSAAPYLVRCQQSYVLAPHDAIATHRTSWHVVRADDGAVVGRYAEHGAAASACALLNTVAGVSDPDLKLELYAWFQRHNRHSTL